MRTVDPDQEQPFYGNFATKNYVLNQPVALDGSDSGLARSYVNTQNPNTALVVAVGTNNFDFFCGLGTINSKARVTHYGFDENSPPTAYGDASGSRQWTSYGGADVLPTSTYNSRMLTADEAIHLVFKYPSIAPGEAVQFSYAYVLKSSDLVEAMAGISSLIITQPTSDMSGTAVRVLAKVTDTIATEVSFYIYGIKTADTVAGWYLIGTVTASLNFYTVILDSTLYKDGTVLIQARATTSGTVLAYKSCAIKNAGLQMAFAQDDLGGTYPFVVTASTNLNMTVSVAFGLTQPNSISFYREAYVSGEVKSVFISSKTSAPWGVTVSVSDLEVGTVLGVKAAVKSGSGAYETTLVFGGVVVATTPTRSPTFAPTSTPTTAPTSNPTRSPTFAPTATPTTAPTSNPTSNPTSSNTVSVCLSDLLGDGWDDNVGLTITTDGITEIFTHDCDCACYDVPSKSGDYEISMLESGIGESHPWEVVWQVKGFYGAEYLGTIGSTLTITNHNDEVFSEKLIDVNATKDSCPKPKPGPQSLHDPAAEDA
jgi:hypothetical protein